MEEGNPRLGLVGDPIQPSSPEEDNVEDMGDVFSTEEVNALNINVQDEENKDSTGQVEEVSDESTTAANKNETGAEVVPSVPKASFKKKVKVTSDSDSPVAKKRRNVGYIEDVVKRGQTGGRSGKAIKKAVNEYIQKTGAQAYFKAYFVDGKKAGHTFQAGENFMFPNETASKKDVNVDELKQSLALTLTQALGSVLQSKSDPNITPSSSTSSAKYFSPTKHTRPEGKKNDKMCFKCRKVHVTDGIHKYASEWIGCEGDGRIECNNWIHSDCLGFPGLTLTAVENLPDYYCEEHIKIGRMNKEVSVTFATQPEKPQPKASIKKTGKRTAK